MWVPLIDFNLLPSVLLVAMVTADKIKTGIRNLCLHSLAWLTAGLLAAGMVKILALGSPGFHPTTTAAIVACVPVMVLHTLATSLYSYGSGAQGATAESPT